MTFRVTGKERDMIRKAQARTIIKSLRAYLLKMVEDGRVIEIELDSVREMNRLLSNATNNINQIAKRVNEWYPSLHSGSRLLRNRAISL